MRSLYLRIWLTVVTALALFALASGWLVQRHLEGERRHGEAALRERSAAWGELIQASLPAADRSPQEQAAALREWSRRLGMPMALDDAQGQRIAASETFVRREAERRPNAGRVAAVYLDDGRTLWLMRPGRGMSQPSGRQGPMAARARGGGEAGAGMPWREPPHTMRPAMPGSSPWGGRIDGVALLALLLVLFAAVAAGAWPVVRGLTRRLEALKQGVEAFGAGALAQRVAEDGSDEVSALARSFNRSAARIEGLVRSHQSLLANASHELRSPLARLKMALGLLENAAPTQRERLQAEIRANIGELDALVDEVLLASRLDARAEPLRTEPVDLLAVLAEEAARFESTAGGQAVTLAGDERLLRRAVRNLLENARRYGGTEIDAQLERVGDDAVLRVCDRGPGVPAALRERIFEPFFRMPGHAEQQGGVGLGLALVRQIAERHGGGVRCLERAGGGSCFELRLPAA